MKILYITNGISGSGGLERVLSIKTEWLISKKNYEVHIITINDATSDFFYPFHAEINFHNISLDNKPIPFYKGYIKALKNLVSTINPNIISVCDDGLKGLFVPRLLKTNIPLIYERHASIHIANKGGLSSRLLRLKQSFMKYGARDYDKLILLTEGNRKEWNLENIQIIPNPISFSDNEVSTLHNKKVILVGSLGYNKGTDLIIQIWNNLYTKFPEWELNIYGKLVDIEKYEEQVSELGVQRLVFHSPVKNIQEKFINSSVAVVPSRSEGFGMVIIEAMQCGLPVVSFDCPQGPGDIISDGEDGFLIEPLNTNSFTLKLEMLMSNVQLRERMSAKAQLKAKEYSVDYIMEKWDELFNSLIN